jgi:hypothetical protein
MLARTPTTWRRTWNAHARATLARRRLPSTLVLWTGPSAFDGSAIALVAHRVNARSQNGKTGDMVQVSIMRADMAPVDAWRAGADGAVCPDACAHRSRPRGGNGTCYVNKARLTTAHAAAVRALAAGSVGFPPGLFTGAQVRGGMEGDPAAVPLKVWARVLAGVKRHTLYTADWRTLPDAWQAYAMASCDTPAAAAEATARGWRVFAASASAADDGAYQAAGMRPCPSDTVGLTCERCGGCDGTARGSRRPSFFVRMHGALGAARRKRNDTTPAACPAAGAIVARIRAARDAARP